MSGAGTKRAHVLGEAEQGMVPGMGRPDMTARSSSQENTMSESGHTAVPLNVYSMESPRLLVGTFLSLGRY